MTTIVTINETEYFGPVECFMGCCTHEEPEPVTVHDKAGLRALEDGAVIEPVVYDNRMFPITLTKDGDKFRWQSGTYPVRTLFVDDFWLYPDVLPAVVQGLDPEDFYPEEEEEEDYEAGFAELPFSTYEVIGDDYTREFRIAALAHLPEGTVLTVVDREDEDRVGLVVHVIKRGTEWHDAGHYNAEDWDYTQFVTEFAGDLRVDFLPSSY